jgi:carboxylesterase type B
MGVFPNQRISPDAGAWHGSEIAHVFGNADRSGVGSGIKATESQLKVSELMNKAWAAFAKNPEKNLLEMGWPLYNEKGRTNLCIEQRLRHYLRSTNKLQKIHWFFLRRKTGLVLPLFQEGNLMCNVT